MQLWRDIYNDQFETVPSLADGLDKVKVDPQFALLYQVESIDGIRSQCAHVKTDQTVAEGKVVIIFKKRFPYTGLFN